MTKEWTTNPDGSWGTWDPEGAWADTKNPPQEKPKPVRDNWYED